MDRNRLMERGRVLLSPLIKILSRVPPNILTFTGLLIVALSSVFIAFGKFRTGGLILIAGTILDAIDGEIARRNERATSFGAFLDSTLDRYADSFIFFGIAIAGRESILAPISIIALLGSYATSYARARADSFGIIIKEGLFTRVERTIIVIIGLLVGYNYIIYFMIVLAIGTNITAIQRIALVYKRMKDGGD